jgi:hypothetical protein
MRLCTAVGACLIVGLLAGCSEEQTVSQPDKNLDRELVRTLNNLEIENAIITQHTLYPYHFIKDAATLNDLGQRDLGVLAGHFKEHPGTLRIQGEGIDKGLYEARVAHVLGRLKDAGVETGRMTLSEGMPGGPGMSSERVVTILRREEVGRATTTTNDAGSMGGMSSGTGMGMGTGMGTGTR